MFFNQYLPVTGLGESRTQKSADDYRDLKGYWSVAFTKRDIRASFNAPELLAQNRNIN